MTDVTDLSRLLQPRAIAAIGASSGRERLSGRVLENLRRFGYTGELFPVNPNRDEVGGLKAVPHISAVAGKVDVAFISVSVAAVEQALHDSADAGVPFAIILTAGYEGEDGREARESLMKCLEEVRAKGLRVLGPNCIGLVDAASKMVLRPAMFMRGLPSSGGTTVISQSGGLSLAVINDAAAWGIGLRQVVHTGNEFDLGLEDFLAHAAKDPECSAIAVSIEQIRRPEEFARHARIARQNGKRLAYLKVGRSARGMAAAATHTGAVAGDADVYDAFLRDLGFVRADTPRELLHAADPLWPAKQYATKSVGVISISGGEAGLSADLADLAGIPLVDPHSFPRLNAKLGSAIGNPVDVTGRIYGEPELLEDAIRDLCEDPDTGSIIMSFPPISQEHFDQLTARFPDLNQETGGRLAVIVSSSSADAFGGAQSLREKGVAVYESLGDAFRKLQMVRSVEVPPARELAAPAKADSHGESEGHGEKKAAKHLSDVAEYLNTEKLPVPPMADFVDGGLPAGLQYPVALKVEHPFIVHRAKIGLVALGIKSDDVLAAKGAEMKKIAADLNLSDGRLVVQEMARVTKPSEVLVGYRWDPLFKHILILGAGGVEAGGEGRTGSSHAYVQVGEPTPEVAAVAIEEAIYRKWLPATLDAAAKAELAKTLAGIWATGAHYEFAEWEVNPLLVDIDGTAAIVDGVGFPR